MKCKIHNIPLQCMGGRNAHPSNWYCPVCDAEDEAQERDMTNPTDTDYKAVNEWAAKECGVTIRLNPDIGGFMWYTDTSPIYEGVFTIEDPRCREIFRNWWLAQQETNFVAFSSGGVTYHTGVNLVCADSNEIACIVAIYESTIPIGGE